MTIHFHENLELTTQCHPNRCNLGPKKHGPINHPLGIRRYPYILMNLFHRITVLHLLNTLYAKVTVAQHQSGVYCMHASW